MPFPTPSADLMASVMGGPLPNSTTASLPTNSSPLNPSTATSAKVKKENINHSGKGTIRIYYSLKENPNAIISYTDLIRQEQKRQRSSSKNGGNAPQNVSSSSSSSANASQSTSSSPLKNSKSAGTGSSSKDTGLSSSTSMDIDPPEGEEALGDGDSEAEDDDEADDDEEEDDAEAEDEDEDDDPDEDDDEDDDPDSGRRETKDFLDELTEKYGIEGENESDDDDEDDDEDGKDQVRKRPSRWDTERYDFEDDFIDDSEMMLESIGMVRPKVDGFFAYRGPIETTAEDADSSDAGPRSKKTAKRKTAVGSSPLNTKSNLTKSSKGSSNLMVAENANDSTSEMSEADEKSKSTRQLSGPGSSSLATVVDANSISGTAEPTSNSTTTTPTKKKAATSKSKSAVKDVSKEEASKDSDKESKSGLTKKTKSKPTKATTTTTPVVRVDSPTPFEDNPDGHTHSPPSRSTSPSKLKSKSKATASTETESSKPVTADTDSTMADADSNVNDHSMNSEAPEITSTKSEPDQQTTKVESSSTAEAHEQSEAKNDRSKSKEPKPLEPLNEEVQAAYDVVADLARKETWEVKSRFPPHIKEPLWACAKTALTTRSSGYVLDENFFVHLQEILPYNKFTLKKLVYKAVLPDWITELEAQRARLIEQFAKRADMVWRASGMASVDAPRTERDDDGDVNMSSDEVHNVQLRIVKSPKKFPWTQDLRLLLWETMEKFMEIHSAKHELRAVDESQPVPPTDSKTRKDAYQTLLQSFPSGWMTSYEISRQYSQLKEKVQKIQRLEKHGVESSGPQGKSKSAFLGGVTKYGGAIIPPHVPPSAAAATNDKRPASTATTAAAAAPTTVTATATPQSSPSAAAPTTAPQNSTSSTPVSVAPTPVAPSIAEISKERDNHRRSSPSQSPAATHRTAHLSEIVNPTSQSSQSRSHHLYYSEGPVSGSGVSEASKKRKNLEEGKELAPRYRYI
ncbi:hypothetical protein BGZ46_010384 [Entomortierella lignicola]|nr:hypothetical protein BGZ46_010384 [Entomortierella lignicola]